MLNNSVNALLDDLNKVKTKLAACRSKIDNTQGEEKIKYRKAEALLEAFRDRLALCLDLLQGKIFAVYSEENTGEVTLVKPGEYWAKLLNTAEKYGARVTKIS